MLDSVVRVNKNYYLRTHLEGCKYQQKKKKWKILLMMI